MEKSIFLKKIAEMAEMAEMPTPQGYSAAKLFLDNIYRRRLGGYDNYINAPYLESFLEGKYDDEDECKAAEQSEFLFQEEYREVYLSSQKIEWICSKNKITHPGYTGRNYRGYWVGSDSTHTYSFAGAIPGSPNVYVKFNEDYAYYIVCDKKKFKSELLSDQYHHIDDVANKGYIVKTKSELIETGWGFEDLPDDGSLFLWKQKEYK